MVARACPACGQPKSRFAFAREGFDHMQCASCRTLFVSPVPSDETIQAVYEDPQYRAAAALSEPRARQEAKLRAEVLAEHGVRTMLEVGSGAGYFLDASAALGMEVEGIEPGHAAERDTGHDPRVHRIWLDGFRPTRKYGAIALWEVIEHLTEPCQSLQILHDWLEPGGMLALSTPSWSGMAARVLGPRFPMISPPEHLELFSRRGLTTLLRRAGFRSVRWSSFSNLDAEALARGFGRYFLGDSGPGRVVAKGLGHLTAAPARVLDRVGLGTSFEVYALRQ
jgi:hypothetical protein